MSYDRSNRLLAIAINALRESRVAHGRDAEQWLDDDAHRVSLVAELLRITEAEHVNTSLEALPLVPAAQAKHNAALDAVAKNLGLLEEAIQTPVKAAA